VEKYKAAALARFDLYPLATSGGVQPARLSFPLLYRQARRELRLVAAQSTLPSAPYVLLYTVAGNALAARLGMFELARIMEPHPR
jgi:hypothetical protein